MNACCFCFKKEEVFDQTKKEEVFDQTKKEEKMVILRVEVFDESSKQKAKEVASKFPGVTEVLEVEGEGHLDVRGEFSISELTKELKKINEPVETEPEVKIQQKDEGKRPINIQKASKPLNSGASSSNWTGSQENRLTWEHAKVVGAGAAEQVKVVGAGAAEQAKVIVVSAAENVKAIGKGAFNLLPNNIKGHYEKKNYRQEMRAVKPQHWKEEEEMKQKKIRQEKEEENRRKRDLEAQEKIRQEKKEEEKRKKQALENNSGGTSVVAGITESLLNAVSKLTTASGQASGSGQPSTSTQAQRTGQPSTRTTTQRTGQPSTSRNTHFQHKETRPVEKKGKNGR